MSCFSAVFFLAVCFAENICSFLMGEGLIVFQGLVLARWHTLTTFIALIGVGVASASYRNTVQAVDRLELFRRIDTDVLERYPDSRFERIDVAEYFNPDELVDLEGSLYQKPLFGFMLKAMRNKIPSSLVAIRVRPSAKLFAGGQSYRSSWFSPSFAFVGPLGVVLTKFLILHEAGHSSVKSGAIANEVLEFRRVYSCLLIWAAFAVNWTPISAALFSLMVLQAVEYAWVNVQDKLRLSALHSEISADKFASKRLTENERKAMLVYVDKGHYRDDKLHPADNEIRQSMLRADLTSGARDEESWIGWNVGGLMQKFIVMAAIALGFTHPTTILAAVLSFVAACILFIFNRSAVSAERQIRIAVFDRLGPAPTPSAPQAST